MMRFLAPYVLHQNEWGTGGLQYSDSPRLFTASMVWIMAAKARTAKILVPYIPSQNEWGEGWDPYTYRPCSQLAVLVCTVFELWWEKPRWLKSSCHIVHILPELEVGLIHLCPLPTLITASRVQIMAAIANIARFLLLYVPSLKSKAIWVSK